MNSQARQYVRNADLVEHLFGGWPRFHDAEVHTIHMDHSGPVVRIEVKTASTDQGAFVTFDCLEVEDLELTGFGTQNVLAEITLTEVGPGLVKLELYGIFGVSGFVVSRSVSVAPQPR